jgi:hypothetical protein
MMEPTMVSGKDSDLEHLMEMMKMLQLMQAMVTLMDCVWVTGSA